jgi:hypothetical protein
MRHRRSVTKAVEVLEEIADVTDAPLNKWSDEQMDEKVELIQTAMEEAYRQHRRSISTAVHKTLEGDVGERQHVKETSEEQVSVEEKIRNAVAVAYERHCAGMPVTSQAYADQWQSEVNYQQQASIPYTAYGGEDCSQQATVPYTAYGGESCYQAGYDDGAYSVGTYQVYDDGAYYQTGWYSQDQSVSNDWYGNQGWCAEPGGYGPCPKDNTWGIPGASRRAPWRWGSG